MSLHSSVPITLPRDLETIPYPSHLAQLQRPDPHSFGPQPSTASLARSGTRQRDFTLGSGSTILLGAVHGDAVASPETIFKRTGSAAPTLDSTVSNEPEQRGSAVSSSSRGGIARKPSVSSRGLSENSVVHNQTSRRDVETDSGGDDTVVYRRRATINTDSGSRGAGGEKDRPEDRIRKSSSRNPRPMPKSIRATLPSAQGIGRTSASLMYFSELPMHGRPPSQALRAHTGTLVRDRIWMLGGVDSRNCWRGVAWFDTESYEWQTVATFGEKLPPLRAHTATLVGELLYIFGGGDGPTYSNDVWTFNTGESN